MRPANGLDVVEDVLPHDVHAKATVSKTAISVVVFIIIVRFLFVTKVHTLFETEKHVFV